MSGRGRCNDATNGRGFMVVAQSILQQVSPAERLDAIGELVSVICGMARRTNVVSAVSCKTLQAAFQRERDSLDLGEWYQTLLAANSPSHRRRAGCYYTPPAWVERLVDASLGPLLARIVELPGAVSRILSLRIIDPACGSGRFLVAVAERLKQALRTCGAELNAELLQHLVEHCLHGRDIDLNAVALCRYEIRRALGEPGALATGVLVSNDTTPGAYASGSPLIRCADSLTSDLPRGAFDLVIGNPPFVNVIDGGLSPQLKERLLVDSPELAGTADLAFHFVRLSDELATLAGVVALVLPRTFLNAPAAERLRARLNHERPPSFIGLSSVDGDIRGAATYLCAVVLGGSDSCRVEFGEQHFTAKWTEEADTQANWWRAARQLADPHSKAGITGERLGDHFEITASMTTGEAYAIRDVLHDAATGPGWRLITSRLIDPDHCRWGEVECRYLGHSRQYPRLSQSDALPASLQRRLLAARRPKLMLSGLCRRFEAYLDANGTDIGAVSTFVIYHPQDDVDALMRLRDWLHGAEANTWLRDELGAASVGHGYMTLKKRVLRELPLPWLGASVELAISEHGP